MRIQPCTLVLGLAILLVGPSSAAPTPGAPEPAGAPQGIAQPVLAPHIAADVDRAIVHLEDGLGRLPRLAAHAVEAQKRAGISWFLRGDQYLEAEGRSIGTAIGQGLAALARAIAADMVRGGGAQAQASSTAPLPKEAPNNR
jgi:hypothetical protein